MSEVKDVRAELVKSLKHLDDLDEKLAAIHVSIAIDILSNNLAASHRSPQDGND